MLLVFGNQTILQISTFLDLACGFYGFVSTKYAVKNGKYILALHRNNTIILWIEAVN